MFSRTGDCSFPGENARIFNQEGRGVYEVDEHSRSCRKFNLMSLLSLGQSDMFHLQLLCITAETVHLYGNFLAELKTSSMKLHLQKRGQRQALEMGGSFFIFASRI